SFPNYARRAPHAPGFHPPRPQGAARRSRGGLAVLRRDVPGAGAQDLPRLRPRRRDRDRQGRGDPRRRGGEHPPARFRLDGHHPHRGRRAPGGARGPAAHRRGAARADRGRDVRHRGHPDARLERGPRAQAGGREDRRVVPHRRLPARLLRARDREFHHPPLGSRSDHQRRDRGAPRLRPEAQGTQGLIDRLTAALKHARADYVEIRLERTWSAAVTYRGRRLEAATASEDQGGFVRALSRAVRLDPPIRLADVPPQRAEALLDLDGDVRGVPLAEKKRLLEAYNGEMLAVSDRIVDTLATYRDEVSEYWYVNSEGTVLHELRPEVTLSGTAVARRDGTIEKGLESLGLRRGWRSVQDRAAGFREAAARAVRLLDAPRVVGGTYPVILDPELAGV